MPVEAYAKRLNNPFQGVLQVVANERVRALSFDGLHWELQFQCNLHQMNPAFAHTLPRLQFARIGRWAVQEGFKPYPLDPVLSLTEVKTHCHPVIAALEQVRVPLPQDDHYEWWLLDEREQQPLALLASCRHEAEIPALTTSRPCWRSLNASQLPIASTAEETQRGLPPVNYRLEVLVKQRAGQNPQARWFVRHADGSRQVYQQAGLFVPYLFPELLLREDWESGTAQALCERYLQRLAPQLLVLQHLSHAGRDRAEQMASKHVIEMDEHFHLYPCVANPQRMTAWRVEARLRKSLV